MLPATVLLAIVLQTPAPVAPAVYSNTAYGFQITIPPAWKQVPDSIVAVRVAAMRRAGAPQQETNYPTAFVRTGASGWFAAPYVLVQVNEHIPGTEQPTLERVAADLGTMGNTARYDSTVDAVLVTGSITAGGGVRIRSYSGIRLLPSGLVSVMAYAPEADSLGTAAIRDQFLAGLRVDPKR